VKPLTFNDVIHLPVIESYQAAFHKATSVPLKVVPPNVPGQAEGMAGGTVLIHPRL
jgi:hypothetical protein